MDNNYNGDLNGDPQNGQSDVNPSDSNGYGTVQNGYDVPQNGYGMPQNGCDVPQNGYSASQNGYGMPQNGYGVPQNNGYSGPPNFYDQINDPFFMQQYEEPDGKAIASLVLGIVNVLTFCIPVLGIAVGAIGLLLGINGLRSSKKGISIAGAILSGITLVASIIYLMFFIINVIER